jgi:hypothetical protein
MEDVLEVYTRPYDPQRPQVCLDETSTQLVAEPRRPIPAAPGQPERVDDEYERQGTAHLFRVFEPLAGQRRVKVTDRRTAADVAQLIREVVDEQYPQAENIVLVMDNLNTPKPASWYEAFPPLRPADCWHVWRCMTPPSLAVGWIWPRPNSASWPANV